MSQYVLELFLDPKTERAVQSLWGVVDALAGWTPQVRGAARPHVSVCSCPSLDEDAFGRALAALAADTPPLRIEFASVASFASAEGVIFLAPVVTTDLLALHVRLMEAMRQSGATVPDLYQPGRWVPHCTLAQGLPPELVSHAVAVALRQWSPAVGRIERVGLVDLSPPQSRVVAQWPLKDQEVQDVR
jgi:2'-5' RNA ligase